MGGHVREIGMQLAAEILDELSRRTFHIRHQRIARLEHTRCVIIPCRETSRHWPNPCANCAPAFRMDAEENVA